MEERKKSRSAAVILAAGQGKRMGAGSPKQYLTLSGRPVLFYALRAFEESCIDDVILVTEESRISYVREEIVEKYGFTKVRDITPGGKERYHSVSCGLTALEKLWGASDSGIREAGCGIKTVREAEEDIVMIHDGARCLVTPALIDQLCLETEKYPACVTGTPVKDTIKVIDEENFCKETPDRSRLWAVQTPQSFSFPLIRDAYRMLLQQEKELLQRGVRITDDAQVCELFGHTKVRLVMGDYRNLKLTTPEDLYLAEEILKRNT